MFDVWYIILAGACNPKLVLLYNNKHLICSREKIRFVQTKTWNDKHLIEQCKVHGYGIRTKSPHSGYQSIACYTCSEKQLLGINQTHGDGGYLMGMPIYIHLSSLEEMGVYTASDCYLRGQCHRALARVSAHMWYRGYGPPIRYVKLRIVHAPRMPRTFSPPRQISDPEMRLGTCVMHVPLCMPESIISGIPRSRWQGKRSRHSRRMRNPQFYVSSKRPIERAVSNVMRITLARSKG